MTPSEIGILILVIVASATLPLFAQFLRIPSWRKRREKPALTPGAQKLETKRAEALQKLKSEGKWLLAKDRPAYVRADLSDIRPTITRASSCPPRLARTSTKQSRS